MHFCIIGSWHQDHIWEIGSWQKEMQEILYDQSTPKDDCLICFALCLQLQIETLLSSKLSQQLVS